MNPRPKPGVLSARNTQAREEFMAAYHEEHSEATILRRVNVAYELGQKDERQRCWRICNEYRQPEIAAVDVIAARILGGK